MRKITFAMLLSFGLLACTEEENTSIINHITPQEEIIGTWKLVYGDTKEGDSLTVKDVTTSEFIKIINETHFAFFNQKPGDASQFYGGAGTYTLENDSVYTEKLEFIATDAIRDHIFPFTIEIKGDSLIQYGHEKVEAANLDRYIVEKYIRIK